MVFNIAGFSLLLWLLGEVFAIYFTTNGPRKLTDGSIATIFSHKEQKEEGEMRLQHTCFLVNLAKILRLPFFKNSSGGGFWRWTQRNQAIPHYIPIEQLLSLNELLWIILAARRNGQVIPLVRMKQNWMDNFIFVFFKRDKSSLEGGAITPYASKSWYDNEKA